MRSHSIDCGAAARCETDNQFMQLPFNEKGRYWFFNFSLGPNPIRHRVLNIARDSRVNIGPIPREATPLGLCLRSRGGRLQLGSFFASFGCLGLRNSVGFKEGVVRFLAQLKIMHESGLLPDREPTFSFTYRSGCGRGCPCTGGWSSVLFSTLHCTAKDQRKGPESFHKGGVAPRVKKTVEIWDWPRENGQTPATEMGVGIQGLSARAWIMLGFGRLPDQGWG